MAGGQGGPVQDLLGSLLAFRVGMGNFNGGLVLVTHWLNIKKTLFRFEVG